MISLKVVAEFAKLGSWSNFLQSLQIGVWIRELKIDVNLRSLKVGATFESWAQ